MKVLLLLAALSVIAGCASMADAGSAFAGQGQISTGTSTFDGSTTVEVSPNLIFDPNSSWGIPFQLGGQWSSATPDHVGIILEYSSSSSWGNAYTTFHGLDVLIEGEQTKFPVTSGTKLNNSGYNSVSKTIYTDSTAIVAMPIDYLAKMVSAENCTIRVHTSDGYKDAVFSMERTPGGAKTARMTLREFLLKVEEQKASL